MDQQLYSPHRDSHFDTIDNSYRLCVPYGLSVSIPYAPQTSTASVIMFQFILGQLYTNLPLLSLNSRHHCSLPIRASDPFVNILTPILPLVLRSSQPGPRLSSNYNLGLFCTVMTDYLEFKTNPKMEYRRYVCSVVCPLTLNPDFSFFF